MKKCSKCQQEKELVEFFKDRTTVDGHATQCKACKSAATYRWRENHKEQYNTYMRAKNKHHYPEYRLKRYKITVDMYNAMLAAQDNKCGMCGKSPSGKRPLAIDHNHKTGKVRGLLCYNCNRLMFLIDLPELHQKAIEWAKKDTTPMFSTEEIKQFFEDNKDLMDDLEK